MKNEYPLYQNSPGYALREFLNEYLLIPVELSVEMKSQVGILNESGQFLWKQLEEKKTAEELVFAVIEEFDVSEETAAQDIGEFLQQLKEYKLLEEMVVSNDL